MLPPQLHSGATQFYAESPTAISESRRPVLFWGNFNNTRLRRFSGTIPPSDRPDERLLLLGGARIRVSLRRRAKMWQATVQRWRSSVRPLRLLHNMKARGTWPPYQYSRRRPKCLDIASGRLAEEALVLPIELTRTLLTDLKCCARGIELLRQHLLPRCMKSKLLLKLQRAHGRQAAEVMMERRSAHPGH